MMKLPKMTIKKLDPAKVFNSLHIVDTTNAGLPSTYYALTTDQRAYVDELINICETYFQYQIDDFNDELEEAEEELKEEQSKKDSDKYSVYEE
jgi:DNA-binding PadR family transcriptional regulator